MADDLVRNILEAKMYKGCSKSNVTCIGAHLAEMRLFILICSALQNTLRQPEHTFLFDQSIFESIFHTFQWEHPSDTDNSRSKGISRIVSPSR